MTSPAGGKAESQCSSQAQGRRRTSRRTGVPIPAGERRVPLVLAERVDAEAPACDEESVSASAASRDRHERAWSETH